MKEVTYEDWQKNPTPRMMWVWNATVEDKVQAKVIFVAKADMCKYPVFSIMKDDVGYDTFQHCAEIEKQKQRRMTNRELARWLREKHTREWKYTVVSTVHSAFSYDEDCADKECCSKIVVREDDGEWREPLVEVEE